MKHQLAIIIAAIIILASVAAGAGAARALQAKPTAVGVVNLPEVMSQLKEQQSVRADLMARQETLRGQQQAKEKEAQALKGDLDLLQAGTPNYKSKEEQLRKAVIDLQVWTQFEAEKLRMEEQLQVESLLRKVNDAVSRVAQDDGYDMVLFEGQQIGMRGPDGQPSQIAIRQVAWHVEAVDLTNQVVQRMNNEFSAGQ